MKDMGPRNIHSIAGFLETNVTEDTSFAVSSRGRLLNCEAVSCKKLYIKSKIIKRRKKIETKCLLARFIFWLFYFQFYNTFKLFSLLLTFVLKYSASDVISFPAGFLLFWPGWRQGLCKYTWLFTEGFKGQQKSRARHSNRHLSETVQNNAPQPKILLSHPSTSHL